MKHYGFRGVSGTKQAMSPKLYNAISERLYEVWGDYAGWAHSVRLMHQLKRACCLLSSGIVYCRLEGIFRVRSAHANLFAK